jgi:NADH dehydrogenase/NADH:ubiquinone oxidoreductase subunit G
LSDAIRKDFWDAINRIVANDPNDAELQAISGGKALKLNISNLAKVSGRSRTHISTIDSEYPDVRERIFGSNEPPIASGEAQATKVTRPSQTSIALSNRLAKQEAIKQCNMFATKLAEADVSVSLLREKIATLEAKVTRFKNILRENGIPFPRE